jgi:hypothetical protein
MSQFWKATAVTTTSGNAFVQVVTGDDVSLISPNSFLQIGTNQFVEVKTVNTSASPQTIELYYNWNGATASGQGAISAPTKAEIKEAAAEIRTLRVTYEGLADSVAVSNAADSLVKRTAAGRIKATASSQADEVVVKSELDATVDSALAGFGIGAAGPTVNDANTTLSNGIFSGGSGSGVNFPHNAEYSSFINMERNTNSDSHTRIYLSPENGSVTAYVSASLDAGLTWVDEELFHSGNSINPLDYGFGDKSVLLPPAYDLDTHYKSGNFVGYGGSHGNASIGENPFPASGGAFHLTATGGGLNTGTNYVAQFVTSLSGDGSQKKFRTKNTGSWSVWHEIFNTGNTNFDTWEGDAGTVLGTGYAINSTSVLVYIPIISLGGAPSDITLGSGNFQIRTMDGGVIEGSVLPADVTLDAKTSANVLVLRVTGLTVTTNVAYNFLSSSTGASIKVNY